MGNIQTSAWIEGLLKKAGVAIDDEIKTALAAKDMSQISDEIAGKIEGGLMNLEEATNHPEVRKKAIGQRLGGLDTELYRIARDDFKLDRSEYEKVRGVYNPDTGRYEGSVADTIPAIISFFNELSVKKGESSQGLDTTQLRAELAEKLKGEYAGKLTANQKTISDYELKIQQLSESIEKKDREMDREKKNLRRDFWLDQENSKYLTKLKPEFADVADMLVAKSKKVIFDKYIVDLHTDGTYQPFQKADPSARALDGNNMIDLQEHIAGFWSKYLNPNPENGDSGNGGTKTVTTGGKPTRKLSAW